MIARRLAAGVVIALLVAGAYAWLAAPFADPRPSVLGARLGMTADQLRALDRDGGGTWTSSVVEGDWVLGVQRGAIHETFELHEGQLVAVRAEGPRSGPLGEGPALAVTPGSVLVRTIDHDQARIALLSRTCPTHHEEAEALVLAHVSAP